MSDGPKLYTNKPKKAQVKHLQQQQKANDFCSPPSSSPSAATGRPCLSSRPPPDHTRESFVRRYKFLWPLLLAVNLYIGAYFFTRTRKKESGIKEESVADTPSIPAPKTAAAAAAAVPAVEKPFPSPPGAELLREPLPENQQRQLFKWMLEEKRKIKPEDPVERGRIDEEKAILKKFIRAQSIPQI